MIGHYGDLVKLYKKNVDLDPSIFKFFKIRCLL